MYIRMCVCIIMYMKSHLYSTPAKEAHKPMYMYMYVKMCHLYMYMCRNLTAVLIQECRIVSIDYKCAYCYILPVGYINTHHPIYSIFMYMYLYIYYMYRSLLLLMEFACIITPICCSKLPIQYEHVHDHAMACSGSVVVITV